MRTLSAIVVAAFVVAPFVWFTTAAAENTKRDHRGQDGAPQGGVTVGGQPAKIYRKDANPKDKPPSGGCEKGDCSGPTVRDHRNQ